MKNIFLRFLLCILLFTANTNIVIGQPSCSHPANCQCNHVSDIDNDFSNDCPSCSNGTPCNLETVDYASVAGVNYKWACIFEDEFTGDSLDKDKWITPLQSGFYAGDGSDGTIDFNTGKNFIFDHPGIELVDSNVKPFTAWPVSWDHTKPQRTFTYTSSALTSQYQFPLFGNRYTTPYGIYEVTCTLPPIQYYTGGPSNEPPYEMIWPSFWMWGVDPGNKDIYGEIDGFEFPHHPEYDNQTEHYPQPPPSTYPPDGSYYDCEATFSRANTFPGQQHTYYIIYTPDEIDWYVDGTLTRSCTKYYREDRDFLSDKKYTPFYYPVNTDIDNLYQDCNFPYNIPMWLIVANAVQSTALSNYFPVNFKIQSVRYWVPTDCSASIDVTSSDIQNYNTLIYNAFTGENVTIDGTTNGAIDVPNIRTITTSNDKGWCHGNLEAIATNKVIVKGSLTCSGYLVLKTDNNLCNEYSGPQPIDATSSAMQKKNGNNTQNILGNQIAGINDSIHATQDSLSISVKNSPTQGQFSVGLSAIGINELNQTAEVSIWNTLGQLIVSKKMLVQEGSFLQFNLANQPRGIYIILLKTNDKVLHSKVILQ